MKAPLFVVAAATMFADEKSLPFAKLFGEQDRQEVATIVRSIADIAQATLDGNALRVSGTAQQIAAAEWIVRELDSPTGGTAHTVGADDVIQILEFSDAQTVQQLQEAATLVRSMSQLRRLFTFNSSRKIVVRGTKAQLEQAAWLLARLPGQTVATAPAELRVADQREPVLRVYTLRQTLSEQQFQETATVMRTIAEIRYLFVYNVNRKLALRGTADQMAMVDFMLREFAVFGNKDRHRVSRRNDFVRVFDAPPGDEQERAITMRSLVDMRSVFALGWARKIVARGSREEIDYCEWLMAQGSREFELGILRKFPLTFTGSIQELQEAATMLRSTGEIWRVFAENASKTVFVRGTRQDIDFAEWMFAQLSSPPSSGQAERKFGTDIVKLVFLKPADAPLQEFFAKVTEARRASGIPRVFTYNSLRAVVMRGTAEQIAKAEVMLR